MRVLSKGGKLSEHRIRFPLSKTLRYLLLGLLAYVVFAYLELPDIGFYSAAILFILAKGGLRCWRPWSLRKRHESAVFAAFKSLPDDYVVLNDLVLPESKGNVDHLVIGPNGVFAIETKNYSGYVKCEEEHWSVNGYRMRSLSKQAKRNSMAVRSNIASLFMGNRTKIPYVVPLLVFVNPFGRLKLFNPTVRVLRAKELAIFIRNYETKRPITEEEKLAIVHHLQWLQPTFKELADYSQITGDRLYGVT